MPKYIDIREVIKLGHFKLKVIRLLSSEPTATQPDAFGNLPNDLIYIQIRETNSEEDLIRGSTDGLGERRALVAGNTSSLAKKYLRTINLLLTHCELIATQPLLERSLVRKDCSFKSGDCASRGLVKFISRKFGECVQ